MVTRIHSIPSRLTYLLNDSFNSLWLWRNNIQNYQFLAVDQFKNDSEHKTSAQPFCVSWLKNLDRLIHFLGPDKDIAEFHFADIGCGTGVVCLYAANNYPFKSILGLDFEAELIDRAWDNLAAFRGKRRSKEIRFIEADAAVLCLEPKKYFLFLFNPFGEDVIKLFLDRNVQTLAEKGSVIAYANDKHVELFNSYPCQISRDEKNNISLISF
jgi:SAM-dependent methyltransferase